MKIIRELQEEVEFLVESANDSAPKVYTIKGPFLQGNIKNRNGRFYPIDVLREEVNSYINQYINNNRSFGELGHPESPTVNLERTSHMIKSLKEDGNNFIGVAKILDTPYGKIVKSLIDEGARLGVSSRAIGRVTEKNGVTMVEQMKLATAADIVADPSGPNCFVDSLMEGKEWVLESGVWKEKDLETAKKIISAVPARKLQEAKVAIFERFLSEL